MPELDINVSNKLSKELSNEVELVYEANSTKGEKFLVKFVNIKKAFELGIMPCLDYNRQVLLNMCETPAFPAHLLQFKDELQNSEITGMVSQFYETTLLKYMYTVNISEKEALDIFYQVLKAIYSITMMGYLHKNIRPAHFVKCVESEVYEQANGASSVYIWDPKYQAPETQGCNFSDEDFKQMIVWNCGSLLLDLLLSGHKLCTKEVMDKFKGQEFTFKAIGIASHVYGKFSEGTKALLGKLLHHDPNKRMKLKDMFLDICPEIGDHYRDQKMDVPPSRITVPQSSKIANLNMSSTNALKDIANNFAQRQKNRDQMLQSSNLNRNTLTSEEQFFGELGQMSRIQKPIGSNQLAKKQDVSIDKVMLDKKNPVRRALELYKSYYDQSELLIIAAEVMGKLQFVNIKDTKDIKEMKLLIKYAVTFVSLINLTHLAEGFNQNKNILDLDADLFNSFQDADEYTAFKDFINFRRAEREKLLDGIRDEIAGLKSKYFCKENKMISDMLLCNYKKTQFSTIKTAYRFIVKYAYDSICEQYNQQKLLEGSSLLARIAMYVTYCLTIDKLYIKEQIPDNFKYYFEWLGKAPTSYVPLLEFKNYIEKAPKENLIENSRFILKKYYNI